MPAYSDEDAEGIHMHSRYGTAYRVLFPSPTCWMRDAIDRRSRTGPAKEGLVSVVDLSNMTLGATAWRKRPSHQKLVAVDLGKQPRLHLLTQPIRSSLARSRVVAASRTTTGTNGADNGGRRRRILRIRDGRAFSALGSQLLWGCELTASDPRGETLSETTFGFFN